MMFTPRLFRSDVLHVLLNLTVRRYQRKTTDPRTPDITRKCSRRMWEGSIRAWRRRLHEWDPVDAPAGDAEEELPEDLADM